MFQQKIIHHTQNQEDLKLNEKKKVIGANSEMAVMFELSYKDFNTAIMKMPQQTRNMLETKESQQTNNLSKRNAKCKKGTKQEF